MKMIKISKKNTIISLFIIFILFTDMIYLLKNDK